MKKWIKKFEWRGKQNYLGYFGNRLLQFMWWCTSNYGRNIWLWILWSFGLILFFAWKYFSLRTDHYKIDIAIIEKYQGFPAYLYYSVVTFTTLGFGDITAKTYKGMFWASLEVILGYIMLGGLISIFATKFARRND